MSDQHNNGNITVAIGTNFGDPNYILVISTPKTIYSFDLIKQNLVAPYPGGIPKDKETFVHTMIELVHELKESYNNAN